MSCRQTLSDVENIINGIRNSVQGSVVIADSTRVKR